MEKTEEEQKQAEANVQPVEEPKTEAKPEDKNENEATQATEEGTAENGEEPAKKKKKKKKKKKSKKDKEEETKYAPREQDNSAFRLLGSWAAGEWKQTNPPTIPIADQFPDGVFPVGEIQEYVDTHAYRTSSAEKKELEILMKYDYEALRKAAECHRQVRKWAQSYIKPGQQLIDIVETLEAKNLELIQANFLDAGQAFPTGISIND
jgi:methionyl aminopeptidase